MGREDGNQGVQRKQKNQDAQHSNVTKGSFKAEKTLYLGLFARTFLSSNHPTADFGGDIEGGVD